VSQGNGAETYTSTDAADFSRRGASVTALPSEEPQSQSHQVTSKATTGTEGTVVKGEGEKESTYSATDAAEFSRRGASMVAWPEER
jgi:hypothetical protein